MRNGWQEHWETKVDKIQKLYAKEENREFASGSSLHS